MNYFVQIIIVLIIVVVYNSIKGSLNENISYMYSRSLSSKKIQNNIEFLKNQLPSKPVIFNDVYRLPANLRDFVISSHYSQESIQEIANHMNFFLGIANPIKVIINFEGFNFMMGTEVHFNTADRVGLYKVYSGNRREIHLTKKFKFDLKHILAILAHESTHNYLDYYRIKKNSVYENEILTDIAAVYIGFGNLLLKGYQPIEYTVLTGKEFTQIGYIKPKDIMKAMNYSAITRNLPEIGYSLSIFQKSRINKTLKNTKKRTELQEWKLNKLKKIEFLENSYNECLSMFDNISNNIKTINLSQKDSDILFEFTNITLTDEIRLKLDLLESCLKNQENLNKKSIIDVDMKSRIIEKKIYNWFTILKKYDLF